MNSTQDLYAYCERQGPGLGAEPLNAISNLAFFFWAWRLWIESRAQPDALGAKLRWLALLLGLVGAGSLAYHTLATPWAGILDVLFIGVFNVSYLIIFLQALAGWTRAWTWVCGAAFVACDRVCAIFLPQDAFNGSVLYLPAVLVLLALTAYARVRAPAAGRAMSQAAAVFCVSLLARTLDQQLCSSWHWGTHFAWHLLNAWVLYRLSQALVLANRRSGARQA